MIGFIITGHGTYAPGIHGAMEMITGKQEKVKVIPFLPEMTLEVFKNEIVASIDTLKKEVSEIIIFFRPFGWNSIQDCCRNSNEPRWY